MARTHCEADNQLLGKDCGMDSGKVEEPRAANAGVIDHSFSLSILLDAFQGLMKALKTHCWAKLEVLSNSLQTKGSRRSQSEELCSGA